MVAYHIARHSKPFSDRDFIKKCMLDVADQVCPEKRQKFEEVSLSRRTLARLIETIGENLTSQLKGLVPSFQLVSLAVAFRTMELPWQKMVSVTTDGCPSLTGKNVGLLRRLSDRVAEVDCTRKLIFLHCIIHQEVLCKHVLDMRHVVDSVVKIVNFIRARGLNHRQFTKLLEDCDSDHSGVPYHTAVRWLSVGKVLRRVWDLKSEILLFLEIKGKD